MAYNIAKISAYSRLFHLGVGVENVFYSLTLAVRIFYYIIVMLIATFGILQVEAPESVLYKEERWMAWLQWNQLPRFLSNPFLLPPRTRS